LCLSYGQELEGKFDAMTKKVNLFAPEDLFRRLWGYGLCESLRGRGRIACDSAGKTLKKHCQALSTEELYCYLDDLEIRVIYYAYFLELLYAEQEAAEEEFHNRRCPVDNHIKKNHSRGEEND